MLPNDRMNPLFDGVVQATEEAILNAMFAAETMTGVDDHKVDALPVERVQEILKKYSRVAQ
jgi:D-aminopeptidase